MNYYYYLGLTLFMNKYVLSYLDGDATLLAGFQMLLTLTCGYAQMSYPIGFGAKTTRTSKPDGFYRHMCVVGGLRFITVLFGLIALNYIAVSFTETVKSSAPAFTVVISRLLLGKIFLSSRKKNKKMHFLIFYQLFLLSTSCFVRNQKCNFYLVNLEN